MKMDGFIADGTESSLRESETDLRSATRCQKTESNEMPQLLFSSIFFCSPGTGQLFFLSQVLIPSMGRITP
jgi:hypothetical protein